MSKLHVVTVSTRDGRQGLPVAQWTVERARAHGKFEVEAVDLREVNLPLFDEPEHPRFRRPVHEHTKRWAKKVAEADAFVFVTPEYNYAMPPSLLNALTYLTYEWHYKAAGFVSYGGLSGGTRSVQMAKQVVTTLKMVALPEAVSIPFVAQFLDEHRQIKANDVMEQAQQALLDELARWEAALRPLRRGSGS